MKQLLMNNKVYRLDEANYMVINDIYNKPIKEVKSELNGVERTIFNLQTAKDCLDSFYALVDIGALNGVVEGSIKYDLTNPELVIVLKLVNEEDKKEVQLSETKTEEDSIEESENL